MRHDKTDAAKDQSKLGGLNLPRVNESTNAFEKSEEMRPTEQTGEPAKMDILPLGKFIKAKSDGYKPF